jgi:hypothetical protein
MASGTERLTGRLVTSYQIDIPPDPGWAQPWRHTADSAGGGVDRDDAPAGGGWQPYGWDTAITQTVLTGSSYGPSPSHHSTGHDGPEGRGTGRPAEELRNLDRDHSGDDPGQLYGAAGADNGGLVATGVSAPWANAPVHRRRADGKQVSNPGGLDLGHRHIHTTERHRQGLHFNRPFLRFIRTRITGRETSSPYPGGKTSPYNPIDRLRTVGPVAPRLRHILRPYGQTDYVAQDQAPAAAPLLDGGAIGGEWAL